MRIALRHDCCWAAAGVVAALMASSAWGQVLPRNRAPAAPVAPGAVAPQPVAPAPGETAGQTRREGRQEARDARAGARQAGETGPQARATARETRQETRQNIQATHPADMGVWFNNAANNGLIVSDVANNGAFANAGLREGDRIVSLAGQPITTQSQFVQALTGPNIGTQPVPLVIARNGQQQTLNLQPSALTQGIVNHDPLYQTGMIIDDRNPNQVLVQRVFPRTPAYYSGLRQGDVITGLNGQPITNLNAFTQGLSQANGAVPLQITRSGQTRAIQLDPSLAAQDGVRTALRPNLDGAAGVSPQFNGAGAQVGTGAGIAPGAAGIGTGAAIGAGATAPGAAVGTGGTGAAAARTTPSGTNPAIPATPSTGAAGGTGPATPATPATPAQPGRSQGAAPGASAGASGQAGAGTSGTGTSGTGTSGNSGTGTSSSGAAGAGTSGATGTGASGTGTGTGTGSGTGAGAGAGAGASGGGAGAGGSGGAASGT